MDIFERKNTLKNITEVLTDRRSSGNESGLAILGMLGWSSARISWSENSRWRCYRSAFAFGRSNCPCGLVGSAGTCPQPVVRWNSPSPNSRGLRVSWLERLPAKLRHIPESSWCKSGPRNKEIFSSQQFLPILQPSELTISISNQLDHQKGHDCRLAGHLVI